MSCFEASDRSNRKGVCSEDTVAECMIGNTAGSAAAWVAKQQSIAPVLKERTAAVPAKRQQRPSWVWIRFEPCAKEVKSDYRSSTESCGIFRGFGFGGYPR